MPKTKSKIPRWELKAGRTIYLDGKPYVSIRRADMPDLSYGCRPVDADTLAHVITNLLNAANIKGSYRVFPIDETQEIRDTKFKVSKKGKKK